MLSSRIALAGRYICRQAAARSHPAVVGIETTNRCNLDCVMCPRQTMTRPVGDMSPQVFARIIEDIAGKVEFVWLQDYGEPFLNKHIFEFIGTAKDAGLKTGISTNGTVMTDTIIRSICASGLDYIIFALDGATKETYERVRVGANFERVCQNIRDFLAHKNATGSRIFTVLQCICMEQTQGEIGQFAGAWRIKGVDGLRIRQLTYSGNNGRFRNSRRGRPCYWLWANPHVKHDGTVVACCQDVDGVLALGNIEEGSFGEIWNGPRMRELRQMHVDGRQDEIPLCRACNMYQPSVLMICGSALLPYMQVNKLVPKIETLLSSRRYSTSVPQSGR
ncbi:MAG TPA: radical SAM protein [Phycisphaerae bacterium]|nr:radical SAM protein [Phycisphaerae bacterium]